MKPTEQELIQREKEILARLLKKIEREEKGILATKEWYKSKEADLTLRIENYDLTKKLEKAETRIKKLEK